MRAGVAPDDVVGDGAGDGRGAAGEMGKRSLGFLVPGGWGEDDWRENGGGKFTFRLLWLGRWCNIAGFVGIVTGGWRSMMLR